VKGEEENGDFLLYCLKGTSLHQLTDAVPVGTASLKGVFLSGDLGWG